MSDGRNSWVGGKSKLMWIINLLAPNRYERSIDVFGGSGTVTLNLACTTANLRVYNDFNGNLVNKDEGSPTHSS
ncbi:DNA adenine methylase [Chakrabartyella piscis]|uniref:DNA adenine methylase n=1 Tax=Chakrabartyella piscis TaxID=2918914 RepID=UPI002958D230|nr:DNA adenine methylase [Chakrabartyella piscis]